MVQWVKFNEEQMMKPTDNINDVFDNLDPSEGELTPEQIAIDMQLQIEREEARQMEEYTTNYIIGVDDIDDE